MRVSEEIKIYDKLIQTSELTAAPCSPSTLDILAGLVYCLSRKSQKIPACIQKMRVYDGETLKDTDPKAKSYQEYRDYAGVDEVRTDFQRVLPSKFYRAFSISITQKLPQIQSIYSTCLSNRSSENSSQLQEKYLEHLKGYLIPKYVEFIGKEIQTAYLESYSEYGQNIFDRYVTYADFWIQDQEYRDPDTGQLFDRSALNSELEKIEKPAGISNPKDFRNEIVNFVLRARANNEGKNPTSWTSYEKLRTVIEKKMFSNTEELLPVISFNAKTSTEEQKKHDDFVNRMMEKGYTRKQVRLLSEWYLRV